MAEHLIDGSFFDFPDVWEVHKVDEWDEHKRATKPPFHAKSCDFVAFEGSTLWLVEVKDYTYLNAEPPPTPKELAQTIGLKIYGTLALLHAVARWGEAGEHQKFSARTLRAKSAHACLAMELPDGGRGLLAVQTPLAMYREQLAAVTKRLGIHRPIVSNRHTDPIVQPEVPWTIRRDPTTREIHKDR